MQQLVPIVGAQTLAALWVTALAASKLRLFNSGFTPNNNTVLADLTAVESGFSGYTAGGYALATWLAGVVSPNGGIQIDSPQVQPAVASGGLTATVAGWFLVDATGDLIACGSFDTPIAMVNIGDGFPITIRLYVGTTNQLAGVSVYGQAQAS